MSHQNSGFVELKSFRNLFDSRIYKCIEKKRTVFQWHKSLLWRIIILQNVTQLSQNEFFFCVNNFCKPCSQIVNETVFFQTNETFSAFCLAFHGWWCRSVYDERKIESKQSEKTPTKKISFDRNTFLNSLLTVYIHTVCSSKMLKL